MCYVITWYVMLVLGLGLYNTCYVMLCYITHDMLYNTSYVTLYNTWFVMLYNTCYVMLYNTWYVMLGLGLYNTWYVSVRIRVIKHMIFYVI